MKITVVGNRNGHAAIHWPGVLLASLMVSGMFGVGVALTSLALRWFSPMSFCMLPVLLVSVIGVNIKRALRAPLGTLPTIG